jgi:hypothetical protein
VGPGGFTRSFGADAGTGGDTDIETGDPPDQRPGPEQDVLDVDDEHLDQPEPGPNPHRGPVPPAHSDADAERDTHAHRDCDADPDADADVDADSSLGPLRPLEPLHATEAVAEHRGAGLSQKARVRAPG